jgi:hypothetical protein
MKAVLLGFLLSVPVCAAQAKERVWDFEVRLDGKPIGSHRFTLNEQGEDRVLRTVADFSVRFMGFVAYRYQHEATERWRGDCLVQMDAETIDDGKQSRVLTQAESAGLLIKVNDIATPAQPGCLMSFAYWNPALLGQSHARLLNSQNGRIENVHITRQDDASIELRGVAQEAQRWRIVGKSPDLAPIELWYSPQGDWLALESKVRGGRTLQYRLR